MTCLQWFSGKHFCVDAIWMSTILFTAMLSTSEFGQKDIDLLENGSSMEFLSIHGFSL